MTYTARKPGLFDSQIRRDRSVRVHALLNAQPVADLAESYKGNKAFTKALTGTVLTLEVQQLLAEHKQWADARLATLHQGKSLRKTERGDFTHLSGRGI